MSASTPLPARVVNSFWRSRLGCAFMVAYLMLAAILFHEALICKGWVCDLVAVPVALPLGLPIAWLTDWVHSIHPISGHIPSFHFRNWYFILPTVLANALFYFGAGRQIEKWAGLLLRRFGKRR